MIDSGKEILMGEEGMGEDMIKYFYIIMTNGIRFMRKLSLLQPGVEVLEI